MALKSNNRGKASSARAPARRSPTTVAPKAAASRVAPRRPGTAATVAHAGMNSGDGGRPSTDGAVAPLLSRLRVPLSLDPFGQSGAGLAAESAGRVLAVSNLFAGIQQVRQNLSVLLGAIGAPLAPPQLISSLMQPDGTPAASLQVQFDPAGLGGSGPVVTAVTDAHGAFVLHLPSGLALPAGTQIALMVHGATSNVTTSFPASQIAANGLAPAIPLASFVSPLQTSILASLQSVVAPASSATTPPSPSIATQLPTVSLGDGDSGILSYSANVAVDQFPFGVFHRLIEPRASIVSQAVTTPAGNGFTFLPKYPGEWQNAILAHADTALHDQSAGGSGDGQGQVSYVDRIPVEQPISVDGFRDQLMGLQPGGTFTADETRPMAGTLGLGYTLWLAQQWTYRGLALGNLVYSLPLAPGEQQQIAIFERTDTASVFESESFSEEQQLQESALADTSTNATFNSAFNEAINGSSSFQADSSSSSWGGSLILLSGGAGSSHSSGSSESSLQGQRNTTQQAAQTTHSAAQNQAAARRAAARTGMRVATASESERVTTTVISNHNHGHALTMQYWEVQRLYDVTTTITGLSMTVLVPLQVVRFMPADQTLTLTDPNQLSTRQSVLTRYGALVANGDVLVQALPRKYQRGLTMLLEFASDPSAEVDGSNASAEDVIGFSLTGSFLACDTVTVTVVTSRGTRIGPTYLSNPASPPPSNTFTTRDALVEHLSSTRRAGSATLTGAVTLQGTVALPPSVSRSDVVGFEIGRWFSPLSYTLAQPSLATIKALQNQLSGTAWINDFLQYVYPADDSPPATVTLSPSELEALVGGPILASFSASVSDGSTASNEQYTQSSVFGVELPQQPYPIPAAHVAPVLKYQQVLEIEKMAAHVVRRTLTYSRAVWASMSADERAILLEAYTIGVPPGGVDDASQMVPLLSCVENRVLGFFGNSMMLPFIIPDSLANQVAKTPGTADETASALDPAQIQEALLAYQVQGFTPPRSTIALPTRGVLGEAVLGQSPSAEKIDISRFWNWQDSPGDIAPAIAPTSLPTGSPSIAASLTAPNSLTNLPSLINNVMTAPAPDNSLLQALGQNAATQKDFSTELTGASQLAGLITNAQNTANSARSDALKTTKDLTTQAMTTLANLAGGSGSQKNGASGTTPAGGPTGQTPGKKGAGKAPSPGGGPGGGGPAGGSGLPGGDGGSGLSSIGGMLAGGSDAASLGDLALLAARQPSTRPRKRGAGATGSIPNVESLGNGR